MTSPRKLRIAVAIGHGTGPELADIFELVVRQLAESETPIELEFSRSSRIYHSYKSLLSADDPTLNITGETIKDAEHFQAFCETEAALGTKVMFRTAISAQALYIVREKLQAVKVELFEDENTSLLLVRDQCQGFYSGSSTTFSDGDTVERTCTFQKTVFERILAFALRQARLTWSRAVKKVTLVYKFHLFDGLFQTWSEEWKARFNVDVEFIQPDTYNRNIMLFGIQPNSLVIAANEYADIMENIFLKIFGTRNLGAQECSFAKNYYLYPTLHELCEFQTVHGSADDLTGMNLVNPAATIRAAATLLADQVGFKSLEYQTHHLLDQLMRDGLATPDQGGSLSTSSFVSLFLSRMADRSSLSGALADTAITSSVPVRYNAPDYEDPYLNKKSVVLVIDLQNDFLSQLDSRRRSDILHASVSVISHARLHEVPVIYNRFIGDSALQPPAWRHRNALAGRSDTCLQGSMGADIHDKVKPWNGEEIFDKRARHDPWLEEQFAQRLMGQRVEHVVLVGLWTDVCVLAAAWGAFQRGLWVTVVKDATISLQLEQDSALNWMKSICGAKVVTTREFLSSGKNASLPSRLDARVNGGYIIPSRTELKAKL